MGVKSTHICASPHRLWAGQCVQPGHLLFGSSVHGRRVQPVPLADACLVGLPADLCNIVLGDEVATVVMTQAVAYTSAINTSEPSVLLASRFTKIGPDTMGMLNGLCNAWGGLREAYAGAFFFL